MAGLGYICHRAGFRMVGLHPIGGRNSNPRCQNISLPKMSQCCIVPVLERPWCQNFPIQKCRSAITYPCLKCTCAKMYQCTYHGDKIYVPKCFLLKCQVPKCQVPKLSAFQVILLIDFLIDGQISSFCPDQHKVKLLTRIMLHKLTQSL